MAAVHFPVNALRFIIFKKANGSVLKDRRKAVSRFVYSAKILSSLGDLVSSLFSNFQLTLAMHSGKMYVPLSFPQWWIENWYRVDCSLVGTKGTYIDCLVIPLSCSGREKGGGGEKGGAGVHVYPKIISHP